MPESSIQDVLKQLLQPPKQPSTLQQGAGLTLILGGLLGALNPNNVTSFNKATKSTQMAVSSILPQFNADIGNIESGYNADIATNKTQGEAATMASAKARGLSQEVGKESISKQQQGLSGAYAAAHDALQRAKVNAGNALSSSMSAYYQNLQQKQLEAQTNEYMGKMGLYGALGGIGGKLMTKYENSQDAKKGPETTASSGSKIYNKSSKLNIDKRGIY